MLKPSITALLDQAVTRAIAANAFMVENPPKAGVEVPRDESHGDYASNIAMLLAKSARQAPLKIAQAIAAALPPNTLLSEVTVAAPGFLNVRLSPQALSQTLQLILKQGKAYGTCSVGQGEKVLLEYVSANPTGPLHVGHGRWAAVGSALANLLKAAGFEVVQEFYINDAGNQMQLLGRSVEARMRQALGNGAIVPEDGYQGSDIVEVAALALSEFGAGILDLPESECVNTLTLFARNTLLERQKQILEKLGTRFEQYFSETTLHEAGAVNQAIAGLKTTGHLYEKDGAWWLNSTQFGDDKDRVVVRENGVPTYLAADVAYHKDKLDRGYTRLINIWGADHHGYVPRMKAAIQALGGGPNTLQAIIGQMVNLYRDGEPVRMSKRSGELVTLEDVVEEVGADAARYFLLMRSTDTTLDFDLGLAKRESADNPVFYVQYAHARICSILRLAKEQGFPVLPAALSASDLGLLVENDERALLLKLASYPDEVAAAALALEPFRMARFAQELATGFHQFYTNCRVLGVEKELTLARLALIVAARTVLGNVLEDILGVSAPERMEKEASV
jgi:arginyl-tRNA synthetase